MFLKCNQRKKDGKLHRYWSIVESYRLANGRIGKRQVLYLGEINDSQKSAWCKSTAALEGRTKAPQHIAAGDGGRENGGSEGRLQPA